MNLLTSKKLKVLAFVVCAILSSCSEEPQVVKIGYLVDMQASNSKETIDAVKLAVEEENKLKRIRFNGQAATVTLIVKECGQEASDAIDSARELIFNEGVSLILGPNSSRAALPASLIAEETNVPLLSNGSTHPDLTVDKPQIFRTVVTDDRQIHALASSLVNKLGISKAAILFDAANVYSRNVARLFEEEFMRLDGKIVAKEKYITGNKDYSHQIAKIDSANAEVLFLPNFAGDIVLQLAQLDEWSQLKYVAGTDSWDFGVIQNINNFHVIVPLLTHPITFSPQSLEHQFIENYTAIYGYKPEIASAISYDTAKLALTALSLSSDLSGDTIINNIKSINYQGVTGDIRFDSQGNAVRDIIVFEQINGKIQPLD